jgi:hypothetical protein
MDDIVHALLSVFDHLGFDPGEFLASGLEDLIQQTLSHGFDPSLLSPDHLDLLLQGGTWAQLLADADFMNTMTNIP